MPAKKPGNGIRETAPGKFVASMYDPRVRGKTRHVGTFTAPPQENPSYKTRRAAEQAARKAKAEAERLRDLQLKAQGTEETVASFAGRWVRDYPRPQETTNRHNAERVKALVRDFGDRPLSGISPIEARAWILGGIVPAELRQTAKHWDKAKVLPDGDVEVPTHKGHHLAVRAMFNDAVRTEIVGTNPFAALNVPEAQGRRGTAITVLTEAELALLIQTAHDVLGDYGIHFGALLETLAWTGLRPGEAWALDIDPKPTMNYADFRAGELHVKFQIDRYGKRRATKWDTKGAGRVVFLLPPAAAALGRAIEDRPTGEVFYTTRGHRMSGRTVGYYWDKVRTAFWAELGPDRRSKTSEKEGGPEAGKIAVDFDLYELRHFFGTQLAEIGLTPPEIADQMGHKDGGALAMERYIHPRKESVKRSMQERFAEHQRKRAIGE
jgi:integrase